MVTTKNPYADFDLGKLFQNNPFFSGDYRKAMEDVSKRMGDFSQFGVDVEGLMAAQRRNFEALTQANRLAAEGMQALARRQSEIFKETMDEAVAVSQELMGASAPEDKMARQSEIVKEAFERALANMKELSEMVAKSNAEAFEVVNARVSESLDELKSLGAAQKAGKKA